MNTVQTPQSQYWARVHAKRAEVAEQIRSMPWQGAFGAAYVTSTEASGRAGRVCAVPIDTAARLVEARTHTLSTEQECQQFKLEQQQLKARRGLDLV